MGDVAQPGFVARLQQPAHGVANALKHRQGLARAVGHLCLQNAVVVRLVQIRFQADGQPDAVIGMGHLVDEFQFGAFEKENPIGHGATGFLLPQGVQERGAGHGGLEITHSHVVLQVIAGLGIGR